jgi:hypothetical protein
LSAGRLLFSKESAYRNARTVDARRLVTFLGPGQYDGVARQRELRARSRRKLPGELNDRPWFATDPDSAQLKRCETTGVRL